MLSQLLSLVGAVLILTAYAGNQRGFLGPERPAYNVMNLLGALLLLWVAVGDRRVGFILLEAAWAAVTLPPLWRSVGIARREAPGNGLPDGPDPSDSEEP